MMGGPPPLIRPDEKNKEPLPRSIREVPGFIRRVIHSLTSRLCYIFRLVWEAKPWIFFVMLAYAVISGIMPVAGALIAAEIINALVAAVSGDGEFSRIVWLLLFQFGYLFVVSLINMIYNMVIQISGELVTNHIKLKIMNKAKTIDLASFDMPDFYEKLENASREAGRRPLDIMRSLFNIISTVISMVSFIAILVNVNWSAPIIIILLAIPTAVINFVYRKKTFNYMVHRSKDRRQMNYYNELMVNKDLAKEVRIFGLSDMFIDCYKKTFEHYFGGIKRLIYGEGAWNIGLSVVNSAVNCGLFLYIAKKIFDGVLTVGDYSLYTGALNSISSGVSTLISTTASIYEGTLFIDNMIAFMNEGQHIIPAISEPLHVQRHIGHTVEFRDVSFVYPGTSKRVLDHVSFTLDAGETAVLVGLNGAGKTTLIKLMTRLYDPTEGVMLLDGKDILKMTPDERAKAGLFLAMQYPVEIPGVSMTNFLRTAKTEIDGEAPGIRQWAKDLSAAMKRLKMDPKFATRSVNEGFSGGEKKRAEVLQLELLKPKFAVLDETDSGLDVDALRIVSEGVNRAKEANQFGILMVTHYTRILKYIKPDIVHVFADGHFVKTGGPELADELEENGYDQYLPEGADSESALA